MFYGPIFDVELEKSGFKYHLAEFYRKKIEIKFKVRSKKVKF